MSGGRAKIAAQLRDQAGSCRAMGSPLYAALLEEAAADVEAEGPVWALLQEFLAPGRGNALALRLMAGVHRLVLSGRAPELARFYPSAGGEADAERAWPVFHEVVRAQREELRPLVARPCQTNEVGRCAALVWGFLDAAARTGVPLRSLEIGASAGLNLRWDRFCYGTADGATFGDPASPVDLRGLWREAPPALGARVEVVERQGCDPNPLDPADPEHQLALSSSVWADQGPRFARLRGALELAAREPIAVERASVDDWLAPRLATLPEGVATVVYHSVVAEYLSEEVAARFQAALAEAGSRASARSPLAWVRLEPISAVRSHGVTVTLWPGGEERVLATCGAHGQDTRAV